MFTATAHTEQPQDEVLQLIEHHDRLWTQLPSISSLSWTDFPWPVLRTIMTPDEITFILVSNYFQSLPEDDKSRPFTDRIKDHLKRWHPDRFESRFLPRVVDADKEKVKRAAGNVVYSLNDLLRKETEWAHRQAELSADQQAKFQREQEKMEAERQLRAAEVLRRLEHHDRLWTRFSTLNELKWSDFPWPVLQTVMNPDEITYISVTDYFQSPLLPEKDQSKPLKNRLKKHLQRWHPDRLEFRVLPHVINADKEKVKQAAGNVICYLTYLFRKESHGQEDWDSEMANPFQRSSRVFCPPDPVAKPFPPHVFTSAPQFNAPSPSPSSQAPPASNIAPPISKSRSAPSNTSTTQQEANERLQAKAAEIQRLQKVVQSLKEGAKKREEALRLKEEVFRKQDEQRKRAQEEGRRRMEEMVKEMKKNEEELRTKAGDALRMEQDAMRKMEEAQKLMLEAERRTEKVKTKEEEVKERGKYLQQEAEKNAEDARVTQATLRRREEETRRKEQGVESREWALRLREQELNVRQEEARKREEGRNEEARSKETYVKRREEDVKRREDDVKMREEAMRKREEMVRQDAERTRFLLQAQYRKKEAESNAPQYRPPSPSPSCRSLWTLRGTPIPPAD